MHTVCMCVCVYASVRVFPLIYIYIYIYILYRARVTAEIRVCRGKELVTGLILHMALKEGNHEADNISLFHSFLEEVG